MKKHILLILVALSSGFLSAQMVIDTVSVGPGYINEQFYQLGTQTEYTVPAANWDLAFAGNEFGLQNASVRINGGYGVELYLYANGTNSWDTVDTLGFDWATNRLVNSHEDWRIGAFQNAEQASDFDFGWGTYNAITHMVNGDRVFIIKLIDGSFRKLIIQSLNGNIYTFKYANLDGSDEVVTTHDRGNFQDKAFGFYSIQNGESVDREPVLSDWDMTFTKYIVNVGGGLLYSVTGVLTNHEVKVAQANGIADMHAEPFESHDFTHNIGTIGYDWKSFNMETFTFDIQDSLVYFVETASHDVYRLVFTGFGGATTGDYIFTQELVGNTVSIIENEDVNAIMNIYPNPASDQVNLTFIGAGDEAIIIITDLLGKEVIAKTISTSLGLNQTNIDLQSLAPGNYVVSIVEDQKWSSQQLIIE